MSTIRNATSAAAPRVAPTETGFIPLIDPTGFGGLIQVPVQKTMDTKGRQEYFKGILRKEVSLCCLFQKGRCHAHEKCHQIHVDQAFMRAIRQQNAHIVSCCRSCKDTASLSAQAVAFFALHFGDVKELRLVTPDGATVSTIPADRVALTTGLIQHAENESQQLTSLPVKKMCRLHLRGACKYGKDCKNIHLCKKLGEGIISPTSSPAPQEVVVGRRSSTTTPPPQPRSRVNTPATAPSVVVGATSPVPKHSRFPSEPISAQGSGSFFDRVSESRRSSVSASPAPEPTQIAKQVERVSTPPPLEVRRPSDCFSNSGSTSSKDFDANDAVGNLSFLEGSVNVDGLCFDPALLAEAAHRKSQSCDWLEMDCGASSTTSQASTQYQASRWTVPSDVFQATW